MKKLTNRNLSLATEATAIFLILSVFVAQIVYSFVLSFLKRFVEVFKLYNKLGDKCTLKMVFFVFE